MSARYAKLKRMQDAAGCCVTWNAETTDNEASRSGGVAFGATPVEAWDRLRRMLGAPLAPVDRETAQLLET